MLNIVYKEVRGLHQAAYVLGMFAFGSQLLALLRDRLLAHQFGAGHELDIYYAAFRIPDLLFVLFASSLSVYVLIPFVMKADETDGAGAGSHLLAQVFSLFLIVYTVIAALAFFFAPVWSAALFPGITNQEEVVNLSRILLLQPFLLGISSLFGVVTQLGHRFVLYALSPLLYNVGIIVGIIFFYPHFGLSGLALGVVLGAFGHLLVQWPFVVRSLYRFDLTFRFDWKQLKEVFALSLPRAFTLSLQQIVLLALFGFASAMAAGSLSVFQFAYNLQSVPLTVIGVSYSVAAFPILAELFAKQERQQFALHIVTALRHIIFWSVPAIALIIVLRAQVVRVVLGSGEFDWADTRLTAAVLAMLSLSLLSQAVNLVVVRAFYAGGHTRWPFYITFFGSILAVCSAYGFYALYVAHGEAQATISSFMRLEALPGSEVLALAFGYALATVIQSLVLVIVMGRVLTVPLAWMGRSLVYAFSAAAVGGLVAYATLNFIVEGIDQEKFIGIFIQGLLAGAAGIAGTILTYAYFKSPELHEIYASFQRKLLKTDVVAPQEEII